MMARAAGTRRCALWAEANDMAALRELAAREGLEVAAEPSDIAGLLDGARLGDYSVVLVWSVSTLSEGGTADTLAVANSLGEHGCAVWSHEEPWLRTMQDGPAFGVMSAMAGWAALHEEEVRAETPGPAITEYGLAYKSGDYQVRSAEPDVEEAYPLRDWLANQLRAGKHVSRRRIIVVDDWAEVGPAEAGERS